MRRLVVYCIVMVFALFAVARLLAPGVPPPGARAGVEGAMVLHEGKQTRDHGFSGEETIIERDATGQFHIDAQVNGEDVRFLVDTGADVVALTEPQAERLGLDIGADDFQPIMQTASGVGYAARVRLDRLGLGDEEFGDVDAVVVRDLGVNLLGQSVLRRLGKVELQGDRMVIEHP